MRIECRWGMPRSLTIPAEDDEWCYQPQNLKPQLLGRKLDPLEENLAETMLLDRMTLRLFGRRAPRQVNDHGDDDAQTTTSREFSVQVWLWGFRRVLGWRLRAWVSPPGSATWEALRIGAMGYFGASIQLEGCMFGVRADSTGRVSDVVRVCLLRILSW